MKQEWFDDPDTTDSKYSFEEYDFLAELGLSIRKDLEQNTFEIFHWSTKKMVLAGSFDEISTIVQEWTPLMFRIYIALQNGPMTRPELVNLLKVPRTTIYDNLVKLINFKMISVERESINGTRIIGRPKIYFSINKSGLVE